MKIPLTMVAAALALGASPAYAGPTLSSGVGFFGAPSSSSGLTGRIVGGWSFEREAGDGVTLVFAPALGLQALPVNSLGVLPEARVGGWFGKFGLGGYGQLGAGWALNESKVYPYFGVGAWTGARFERVDLTFRGGLGAGHLDQGWLDLGFDLTYRF